MEITAQTKKYSKLLIDEPIIAVYPSLATALGINQALILQQVHYWLGITKHIKRDKNGLERSWVYNSYADWKKQFPWLSEIQIKRIFLELEKKEILISDNFNRMGMDRTKWYSINYEELDLHIPSKNDTELPSYQNDTMDRIKMNRTLPYTTTETTKEIMENGECFPASQKKSTPTQKKSLNAIEQEVESRKFIDNAWEESEDSCSRETNGSDLYSLDEEFKKFEEKNFLSENKRLIPGDAIYMMKHYFTTYSIATGKEHARIKKEQIIKIAKTFESFAREYSITRGDWKEIVEYWFYGKYISTDYNINHFASYNEESGKGILVNCYYDAIYTEKWDKMKGGDSL